MDCSLPGSSVHGTLQDSGWPWPLQGNLPNPGTEPGSPALKADSLPWSHQDLCFTHWQRCPSGKQKKSIFLVEVGVMAHNWLTNLALVMVLNK